MLTGGLEGPADRPRRQLLFGMMAGGCRSLSNGSCIYMYRPLKQLY
jgi:hypothetical protein